MKPSFVVLFDERWHVGRLSGQEVELRQLDDASADAASVKRTLEELGYSGGGVCLALPSGMVASARIDCGDLPRTRRRTGMLCLLEEQLPLDIESITAEFLPPAGNWAMGVAVETAKVKPLVDPLEAVGIEVAAICPLSLLALWGLCRTNDGDGADYALVRSGTLVDIFRLKAGQPAAWYTVPDDTPEIIQCIMADQLSDPPANEQCAAWAIAESDWPIEAIKGKLGLTSIMHQPQSAMSAATRVADAILGGQRAGWINLRRDGLAMTDPWAPMRKLARLGAVMGILLPLVFSASLCWRGMQYNAAAENAYKKEEAAYIKAHPNHAVPQLLNATLRSDLARLVGVSGAAGQVPQQVNALETFRQIVASFDPAIRMRVLDFQLGPTNVLIDGQTRSYADAEAVSRALTAAGFAMDPPRTEGLPNGGVSFVLSGKPPVGKEAQPAQIATQTPAATEPASRPAANEDAPISP